MSQARIVSINISQGGIPKLPLDEVGVGIEGLQGDGHNHEKHRTPVQAVCLQDMEKLEELNREGYDLKPGATGENLTVSGLNINSLSLGTQLHFANGVVLELTKIRKPCYVLDAINPNLKNHIVGRCGAYAKVLSPGILRQGEFVSTFFPH